MRLIRRGAAVLSILLVSLPTQGHSLLTSSGAERQAALLSAIVLGLLWLCYGLGSLRHPPRSRHALLFHLAMILCCLAVFGPLDQMAETSAAAHMVQHMAFMAVITPLWVLARPLPQLAATLGGSFTRLLRPFLRLTQYPMLCAWLHAMAVWFWHMPKFYRLALDHPWWHVVEHSCFLLTALLLWWAVLKRPRQEIHWALLALLFTLVHTGFLGAMLTFAQRPLYGIERSLPDQQLAGLIMWVPGAIPYMLAAGSIVLRWYHKLRLTEGGEFMPEPARVPRG